MNVLISTYWNVNVEDEIKSMTDVRFNLNLLECKFTVIILYHVLGIVLISTYWNVNADNEIEVEENMIVLISTYWNVNVFEHNAEQQKF